MVHFLSEISLNGSIFVQVQTYFFKLVSIQSIWYKNLQGGHRIVKPLPVTISKNFLSIMGPDTLQNNEYKLVHWRKTEDWYIYSI